MSEELTVDQDYLAGRISVSLLLEENSDGDWESIDDFISELNHRFQTGRIELKDKDNMTLALPRQSLYIVVTRNIGIM